MTQQLPSIYFYLPNLNNYEIPDQIEDFKPSDTLGSWIIQTYIILRNINFPCQLVDQIPDQGIVIGHRFSFPYNAKPSSKALWICIKADHNPHPFAQWCLVQNPTEVSLPPLYVQSLAEGRYLLPGSRYFIPHWPQPGIIPRDSARGDRFENIAFFGISYNLARELKHPDWKNTLHNMGLNWLAESRRDCWHDYSSVDAIVAVRQFNARQNYSWKPASKLYNAWNAGIPAILGAESAFQAERKNDLDYFEVTNYEELINAITKLKENPDLRRAIVENGKRRAKEIQIEALIPRWQYFLEEICIPSYQNWCSQSPTQQQQFFLRRRLAVKLNQLQMKTLKVFNPV